MRSRAASATTVPVAALLSLAGCNSHAPVGGVPAPPTYSTTIRAIAACPAGVTAPAAVVGATPAAANGPTVALRVGGAVTVPVAAGSRVGLTGDAEPGDGAVVCRTRVTSTSVTLLARTLGYVRVAIVAARASKPLLVFVAVNPG